MPDDLLRLHRNCPGAGGAGVGPMAADDMRSMDGRALVYLRCAGRSVSLGAQLMEDIKDGGFGGVRESAGGNLAGFLQQLFSVGHDSGFRLE